MGARKLLISIREKNNWKQEYVAEKLGISQQMVSLIENGKRNPTIVIAKKYELLYGIPMEELFPDIFLNCNVKETN